jgi:NitT/TauT family transport system substrate-binding protein
MRSDARNRVKYFLSITLVVAYLTIQGCSDDTSSTLRVGTTLWPGYEPLHLATAMGYVDAKRIALVDSSSPHGSIQGLRNGDLDAVALTLDEVLLLVEQKIPLKVVLVFDFSNGGDAILANKDVADVAALKGKRVGLESTALGTYMLSRALEINGLVLDDVEKRYLKVSGHRQALQQGKVDAVVTFDPVRSELLSSGARELFSSRDIPREIVDVLAVRQSYLEQHPQRVRELIDGWYRALDYLAEQPQLAVEIMGKRLRQNPAEVLEGFSNIQLPDRIETRALMNNKDKHQAPLVESTQRLASIMLKQQMLHGMPDINALITPDYLH